MLKNDVKREKTWRILDQDSGTFHKILTWYSNMFKELRLCRNVPRSLGRILDQNSGTTGLCMMVSEWWIINHNRSTLVTGVPIESSTKLYFSWASTWFRRYVGARYEASCSLRPWILWFCYDIIVNAQPICLLGV